MIMFGEVPITEKRFPYGLDNTVRTPRRFYFELTPNSIFYISKEQLLLQTKTNTYLIDLNEKNGKIYKVKVFNDNKREKTVIKIKNVIFDGYPILIDENKNGIRVYFSFPEIVHTPSRPGLFISKRGKVSIFGTLKEWFKSKIFSIKDFKDFLKSIINPKKIRYRTTNLEEIIRNESDDLSFIPTQKGYIITTKIKEILLRWGWKTPLSKLSDLLNGEYKVIRIKEKIVRGVLTSITGTIKKIRKNIKPESPKEKITNETITTNSIVYTSRVQLVPIG